MKRTAYAAGMKDRQAQAQRRKSFRRATGYAPTTMLKPEKKYLDKTVALTGSNQNGTMVNSICEVPQGTADASRVGGKINIVSVNMHCIVSVDDVVSAQWSDGNVRMIVFQDKQANGAGATVTDILETANVLSFRNLDNVDRFVILADKIWTTGTVTSSDLHTSVGLKYYKWSKKVNIPVSYSGATGAVSEIKSNNIGLLVISVATLENVNVTTRIRYTDA